MEQSTKYLLAAIGFAIVSALLVWLPNTWTMLDPWRVLASMFTGVISTWAALRFLLAL